MVAKRKQHMQTSIRQKGEVSSRRLVVYLGGAVESTSGGDESSGCLAAAEPRNAPARVISGRSSVQTSSLSSISARTGSLRIGSAMLKAVRASIRQIANGR